MKKRKLFTLGLAAVAAVGCTTALVSCGGGKGGSSSKKEDTTTTFNVQFVTNGGTEVAKQTVKEGNAITAVTTTKSGYTFAGWFTDAECTAAFDVTTRITASTILYAKWTEVLPNKYSVTFNVNGGSSVETQQVTENTTITAVTTTRDGYTFAGWYTDAAYTTAFDVTTNITANTVLYAKWDKVITPYDLVKESENMVFASDFTENGTVDAMAYNIDDSKQAGSKNTMKWGTQGLFKFITKDGSVSATNDAKIENGKLNLINTTDAYGTQVVYDLGTAATSGIVEFAFDLTPAGAIDSVTPIQVYGKDATLTSLGEVFGIRTVSGKFQYRKDGKGKTQGTDGKDNSWYEGLVDGAYSANTAYTFYIKIDLSTGKLSATLNGAAYLNDLDLGITEIQGIRFASGDGNTKTFSLDNFAVAAPKLTVAEAQTLYTEKLDTYVTGMNVSTNYTENNTAVTGIVTTQKAAIEAATSVDMVIAAYNAAVEQLKAVDNDTVVAANKTSAKAIVDAIAALPKSTNTKAEILAGEAAIVAARTALTGATAKVKAYIPSSAEDDLAAAEALLEATKNAVTPAEKVEAAVATAKAALDTYAERFATGYTANASQITSIISDGKAALDAIATEAATGATDENVDTYINETSGNVATTLGLIKETLDAVKSDALIAAATAAKAALDTYVDAAEYTTNATALETAIANGKTAIDAATTEAAITNAKVAAYDVIDAIKNDDGKSVAELFAERASISYEKSGLGTPVKQDWTVGAPSSNLAYKVNQTFLDGVVTVTNIGGGTQWNKGGYFSTKNGSVLTITLAKDSVVEIYYTSVSANRAFTLASTTDSTFTSVTEIAYNWSKKTKAFDLKAGTYTITTDTTEHKIGYISVAEKGVQNITEKVDSVISKNSKFYAVTENDNEIELSAAQYDVRYYAADGTVATEADAEYMVVVYGTAETKANKFNSVKVTLVA